jgi:ATP-dependent helicase/nuclease subunit A
VDIGMLTSRLKTLYAEALSDTVVDGVKPVELMTIHKAKGLEWDVVLVPGLERGGGRSTGVLLNWLEFDGEDAAKIVLAPIWSKGTEKDKLSGWLSGVRAKREGAERKRLMYVASTRAREQLHLFGAVERKVSGELKEPRHDSLLRAVWRAAAERFEGSAHQGGGAMVEMLQRSLPNDEDEGLALAAGIDKRHIPRVQRLPAGFDPGARFRVAEESRLDYPICTQLRRVPAFERPDGTFGARAFGNVVHRYLDLMARRMEAGISAEVLAAELPEWLGRLTASLRGDGLAPVVASREAIRALKALTMTVEDSVGRWILSPHPEASSERELNVGAESLRADRTFVAGADPGGDGASVIWIVDFKTTEQGARNDAEFEDSEKARYRAQLEAYATLRRKMPGGERAIRLGLYYPLMAKLIRWESEVA